MTYPIELRGHVLSIREKEGLAFEETSRRFGVGRARLTRWVKRLEPNQSAPRKRRIDLWRTGLGFGMVKIFRDEIMMVLNLAAIFSSAVS